MCTLLTAVLVVLALPGLTAGASFTSASAVLAPSATAGPNGWLDHVAAGDAEGEVSPSSLQQMRQNLETVETLLDIEGQEHASDLHRAVALAQEGAQWQAATFDLDWVAPLPIADHASPSAALLELAARHGVTPTESEREDLLRLDALDEPVRSALTHFVGAFLAFDAASRLGAADAALPASAIPSADGQARLMEPEEYLQRVADGELPVSTPARLLQEIGIDLTLLLPTRNQFLDSIVALQAALQETGVQSAAVCAPVQVAPAFSIDVLACDSTYVDDFALLLDIGGADVYLNNAGGTSIDGGSGQTDDGGCLLLTERSPAAAIDLGDANDRYSDGTRGCAVNGGGLRFAGLLFDMGGDDTYTASYGAQNGGGWVGAGSLIDVSGNDVYTATRGGTNGGSSVAGAGSLVDALGLDRYTATEAGTNGGSATPGAAFFVEGGGSDVYRGSEMGSTGGTFNGVTLFLEVRGHDLYEAGGCGVLGGASTCFVIVVLGVQVYLPGIALLFDAGGFDDYLENIQPCGDCSRYFKGDVGIREDN